MPPRGDFFGQCGSLGLRRITFHIADEPLHIGCDLQSRIAAIFARNLLGAILRIEQSSRSPANAVDADAEAADKTIVQASLAIANDLKVGTIGIASP
jgi:hypothetical protein